MFLFTYFKRYPKDKDEDEVTDDTLDKWDDELQDEMPELPKVVLHVPEIIVQEPSQDIKKEKEIQPLVDETEISTIRTKYIKEIERTDQPENNIPIFYATCTYPTRTPHIMEETLEFILGEVAFLQFMYYHSHH